MNRLVPEKNLSTAMLSMRGGMWVRISSLWPEYWELTKPRLSFLVLVTTFVGYCMATVGRLDWALLGHTMLGTAFVAGGAAALNQWIERDLDARMKRTAERPLPSGRLASLEALVFGAMLTVMGMLYLVWTVNLLVAFLTCVTLSSYLFLYTPLKTRTPLCTLVGAIPGAIPPMIGWAAVEGRLGFGAWLLFGILFCWQMPHFYALARMYREDYEQGGFPMLTVLDREGTRTGREIVFYILALINISLLPTFIGMTGMLYFGGALALGVVFLVFGLLAAFHKTVVSSRKLFLASIFYLPAMLLLMVADKVTLY